MARKGDRQRRRKVTERHGFWFRLCVLVIWPLAQLLTRRRRAGMEQVPPTGGVLLVANHVSIVDPLTMAQFVYDCGRLPHFLAKASLFDMPVVGPVMRGTGQIPVARGTTDAAGSLSAALQALQDGKAIIIYPEGTTSRDPQLWPMRARTGVARLALTAGVPVLPVTQWGPQEIFRSGGHLRPFSRPVVHVRVGAPLDLSRWEGQALTPAVLRAVTESIMDAITAPLAEIRAAQPPVGRWDPRTGTHLHGTEAIAQTDARSARGPVGS
jgi:1-acyl-sn-glycerol-3-phosphate acyltransferase